MAALGKEGGRVEEEEEEKDGIEACNACRYVLYFSLLVFHCFIFGFLLPKCRFIYFPLLIYAIRVLVCKAKNIANVKKEKKMKRKRKNNVTKK